MSRNEATAAVGKRGRRPAQRLSWTAGATNGCPSRRVLALRGAVPSVGPQPLHGWSSPTPVHPGALARSEHSRRVQPFFSAPPHPPEAHGVGSGVPRVAPCSLARPGPRAAEAARRASATCRHFHACGHIQRSTSPSSREPTAFLDHHLRSP